LDEILKETLSAAQEFNLRTHFVDRTKNTINLRIVINMEIFIQIYANEKKDKLNCALLFHDHRIYGHDKEGGEYHLHPFDNPDSHIFTFKVKPIREFVIESMFFLENNKLI